ncbi:MAG: cytochrome c oxidase subunit II [Geobacteraceae bacterium GWC2_58_44]|nr:MAG: cytochrome c oxidase subunit II [Geobacteraceae bacterium GWC2_58_44]HBG07969.1 cytochrome c oxidase subunit II [Geobacter sp.]
MDKQLITTTQAVDPVFIFIFGACLVLLVVITVAMLWFVIRYHRSRAPEPTSQQEGSLWLEIIWTGLPTLLVLAMFYYGWSGYLTLRDVPPGAMQATAVARMWSWSFQYENGKTSSKLYVPIGKPVQVNLESRDVLHGFYMPAFRIKRDAVPGMKNHVWFVATRPGSYDIFCSQYCGTNHSAMISTVEAIPPEQFEAWLNEEKKGAVQAGLALLEKYACLGCHSLDGTKKIGPSFKGIFGRKVMVTKGGKQTQLLTDEAYLRESILAPAAAVVEGFPPIMPVTGDLQEAEVTALVEYLKELK